MDKAAKAEAKIKQVCDRLGITPAGRKWLDTALDPFKDILQKPDGYPDRVMAPSVVQTIHDSLSIKAPVGVTGNWDCNIFLDSLWNSVDLRASTRGNGTAIATGAVGPDYKRGGCIIRGAAAGTPLDITKTYETIPYATDVFDDQTSARCIAIGMEVHNTTAELYKQGSVITYMVSDEVDEYVLTPYSLSVVLSPICKNGVELVKPPLTATEAIDLPGSLQWDAAKGCYVVPRFVSESNNPQDLGPLVALEEEAATYCQAATVQGVIARFDDVKNALIPITLSGAYFTGLSPQTELTINLTYYVEQFPSINSNLRRLTSSGCPEDFAALELYTKIVRHMPTGVEVNDNFLGAFVAGIARVASMVAPYIPRLINAVGTGMQVAQALNQGINRDNRIVNSNSNNNSNSQSSQNSNRQLVTVDDKPKIERREIKVYESPSRNSPKVVIQDIEDIVPDNKTRKTNTARSHTVKNRRNKDYNRLAKYIKAGNAGNKYIQ